MSPAPACFTPNAGNMSVIEAATAGVTKNPQMDIDRWI
jgi:hypothetical protein